MDVHGCVSFPVPPRMPRMMDMVSFGCIQVCFENRSMCVAPMVSLKCIVSGRFLGHFRLLRRETQGRNISPYLADNRAFDVLFQAIGFSGIKKEVLFARCEEDLHHRTSSDQKKHLRSDVKGHNYPFAGSTIPLDRVILKFYTDSQSSNCDH